MARLPTPELATKSKEVKNTAEFETLKETEVTLAKGRLLVAAKKVIGDNGQTEFVSISKADDRGRFKQTLTIPKDAKVVRELTIALQSVV